MAIRSAAFSELRLEQVGRTFGAVDALKAVDLTIRKGEFICLLGPSGCGKSTTLNIIAGLLPATRGSIWLDDKRIDGLRPEERGFGMVFQNYALFPHMSVRKNIGFGLAMRGVPRAEIDRRVEEAIQFVRLGGQEDKLPGQLSGGQQQRVAIARAIVIEPPLVLMDEPLSNLDAKLRLEMRSEIRRIHNSLGATTIYVTHDQEEALSLADRIVVMSMGSVRQVGTPAELYGQPQTLDVADFMGFRNRLEAVVKSASGGRIVVGVGDAEMEGHTQGRVTPGQRVTVAIRTEDLTAIDGGGIPATVVTAEFRGHSFTCYGTAAGGAEVFFRSARRLAAGETVQLGAPAERVLVFAEAVA
ncbi:MAG TPA: ABC transporter ATP-binding protein [Bauldia sp.]|nr:ABC transporter ATP-binding protein [Bauldia sp.]